MTSAARAAEPSKGKTEPRRGAALLQSRSDLVLQKPICLFPWQVYNPFLAAESLRGLGRGAHASLLHPQVLQGTCYRPELVKHSSKQLFF